MFDGVVTPQMLGPVVPAVLEAVGAVLSIRRGTTTSGTAGCAVVVGHGKQVKRFNPRSFRVSDVTVVLSD